jgi:NitT/TauT family transport system ATP-binding protein
MIFAQPAESPRTTAVQFDGVTKTFHNRAAVVGVSLKIPAGSFTVLVGPSGCGKSTLLNMVAGLDFPSEGYVFVHGRETRGPTPSTALLFQSYNLFPWMTALANVAFALVNSGMSRKAARAEAQRLLAKVGLAAYAGKVPSELSGGMKQRVALVRAFALKPKLLLLDEPFAALDYQTRKMMQAYLLTTWRNSDATVLMVTHDLSEALTLADRVILFSGSPGYISEAIDLDTPRPRDLSGPQLRSISRRLEAHLEVEVARGEFSPEELAALSEFMNDRPQANIDAFRPE